MQERNPVERGHGGQADLESRLAAYYGPELHEKPLPESSWLSLRTRLESQRLTKLQRIQQWYHRNQYRLWPGHLRGRVHRNGRPVPAHMRDAFSRLIYETRQPYPRPALYCSYKPRIRVPAVHVSLLGRQSIKLILPVDAAWTLEPPELDVLLATGLARRFYIRKLANMLLQLLFVSFMLFACITLILFGIHKFSILPFLIAIILCAIVLGLKHIQRRRRTFQADILMVQWLGRSRTCQGLHTLASRSRSRRKWRWGEPSLAERIDRVCGSQVPIEYDHLTLVR